MLKELVPSVTLVVAISGLPAFAGSERDTVSEEVGVSVVEVPVRVSDKQSRPITGLRADDFIVKDNGTIQTLLSVAYVGGGAGNASQPGQTEQLPPQPRTLVLLFDRTFMSQFAYVKAVKAACDFVATQMQPEDSVAVLTVGESGWRVLTAPSKDRERIVQAIGGTAFPVEHGPDRSALSLTLTGTSARTDHLDPESAWADLSASAGTIASSDVQHTIRSYLTSLQSLAMALAAIPGPKSILFFSIGMDQCYFIPAPPSGMADSPSEVWAVEDSSYESTLLDIAENVQRALASAECRVYAIDPSGLPDPFSGSNFKREWFLQSVASETGGRLYANRNDMGKVIESAASEAAAYYLLLYSAPDGRSGRYHKIDVSVRRAGAKISHRKGYYEPRPFAKYTEIEKIAAIEAVFAKASKIAPDGATARLVPAVDETGKPIDRLGLLALDLDPAVTQSLTAGSIKKVEVYVALSEAATGKTMRIVRVQARAVQQQNGAALRVREIIELPEGVDDVSAVFVGIETGSTVVIPSAPREARPRSYLRTSFGGSRLRCSLDSVSASVD